VHHGPRPIAPSTALLAQTAGHTMGFDTFPLNHNGDSASRTQTQHDDDQIEMQQNENKNEVARYDDVHHDDASG
jgi:hypothetical protein